MRWLSMFVLLASCSTSSTGDPAISSVAAELTAPDQTTNSRSTTVDVASASSTPAEENLVAPRGFASTTARLTKADGTTCEICVWLAETSRERARGLMGVTDLGSADAMAFVYPDAHNGTFWMKNTLMPLSISFFAPDGEYLDAFDMEPCVTADCPSYATPADFLIAVEVPQGALADLGIVSGSTLDILDLPCDDS